MNNLIIFLDPPKNVSVSISASGQIVEGDSVTLNCSGDSNPPAEISWFKGGTTVGSGMNQKVKVKVKVCFIVNSATCTVHTYRELKLHYSLTPWCIQITLNTNSRT